MEPRNSVSSPSTEPGPLTCEVICLTRESPDIPGPVMGPRLSVLNPETLNDVPLRLLK
jgi:hypothetical protein